MSASRSGLACLTVIVAPALSPLGAQAPHVDLGVAVSWAALIRDSFPGGNSGTFMTNHPSRLDGAGIAVHAVLRGRVFGVRGEVFLWNEPGGETLTGVLIGPVLRLGERNPLIFELSAGVAGVPITQDYFPSPEEDYIWWNNPMREHVSGAVYRAGVVHERQMHGRLSARFAASFAYMNVPTSLRRRIFDQALPAALDYHYTSLEAGVVWSLRKPADDASRPPP